MPHAGCVVRALCVFETGWLKQKYIYIYITLLLLYIILHICI